MRIVLDSNVLVSMAIRSRRLQPLRDAWEGGRFTALVSAELLAETEDVLRRPKLATHLSTADVAPFLRLLRALGEPVSLTLPYPEFSDPKDRYLLAMLRDGDADLLVTGDKALLKMEQFEGKSILSAAAFVEGLGQ